MKMCSFLAVISSALLSMAVQLGNVGTVSAQVRDIGSHRQLFIDDWIVTKAVNVSKELGTVVKSTGNPILVRDKPWDAGRNDLYGSAVYDPVNDRLQIFYSAVSSPAHDDRLAYAESYDGGETWTKPNMSLIPFGEHKQTNLLLSAACEYLAGPSVFRDAHETDPAKRYKMFTSECCHGVAYGLVGNYYQANPSAPRSEGIGEPGMYVAYSPDGIHWTRPAAGPFSNMLSDTTQSAFWDERTGKYVAYVRARVNRLRSVGRMESTDFETWTEPQVVLACTTSARQIYSMGVTPYQGVYIGTPWMFHEAAKGDQPVIWPELALSRDGASWSQPFAGQPFVPTGAAGSGDSLQIRMSSSIIEMDDKIILIYGQTDQPHVADMQVDIGLATMRLDGFAAMVAGDTEGWILTKLLQAKPGRLMVNADVAPGGYVKAKILGQGGAVLSGYELTACTAATGDSIKTPLVWKTKTDVPKTDQQPLQIHFILKNAKLYSFWMEPT